MTSSSRVAGFDAQRQTVEQRELKELNVPKPLLQVRLPVSMATESRCCIDAVGMTSDQEHTAWPSECGLFVTD